MDDETWTKLLGPAIAGALEKKGYATLTTVQLAVLDPEIATRDLRITSQTGSGKTVAIGFAVRDLLGRSAQQADKLARPRVLIIAPTRELAKQEEKELQWLFAPMHVQIASVTGGAVYRDEHRALAAGPAIIVGTPGRLLDHLKRGVIELGEVKAVVLDEADRMLDMGFREELDGILAFAPKDRRTHLVSATFPREVKSLADRVQRNPFHVEGTRLGEANTDIDHVVHLIDPHQRIDAIINLLLANPEEDTLIFARTRVEVAEIAAELSGAGFKVASLSGDLEQAARDRALSAFRRGDLRALVATDVAARGIDVLGISRVIHAEPPSDPDSYTHRSGRTGRAGRKGTSSVLVSTAGLRRTIQLLNAAGVVHRFEPIPTAASVESVREESLFAELTAPDPDGFTGFDNRIWSLAKRLAGAGDPTRLLAKLLTRAQVAGPTRPRDVKAIELPSDRPRIKRDGADLPRKPRVEGQVDDWTAFHVSWGQALGADARKLLAIVCRRGGIDGRDVGSIRIAPSYSVVDVRRSVAEAFEEAASKPDPRNPRVKIRRERVGTTPLRETPAHGRPVRAPFKPRTKS